MYKHLSSLHLKSQYAMKTDLAGRVDEEERAQVSNSRSEQQTVASQHHHKELDAGALFVLKSRGSWHHCGYHLTTAIVGPALLSLPFAFSLLGWYAGVLCLIPGAAVTFYSYNLITLVLEHHAQLGQRQLRFRDMAHDILGPRWDWYYVSPLQISLCYSSVTACILLAGQSLKFIYLLSYPHGTMELYEFLVIAGVLMLVLAQIPSFHSLRHINLVSLILCLAYSVCCAAGSICIGYSDKAPSRDYSVKTHRVNHMFGVYNAISIIATTYGNGIVPEIQATIAPPVKGKMFKGLCLCYAVILATYFSVAISGYWAFGNHSGALVLSNFMVDGKPLLPKWFLLITNVLIFLQGSAVGLVYQQLINEIMERKFADPKNKQFSLRNIMPRLVTRSLSVVVATTIASMFPFFGDISAVLGAFGFIPLDFVLPMIFYNFTFKPSKRSLMYWVNTSIIAIHTVLGVLGATASIRQIITDAKMYKLFANI